MDGPLTPSRAPRGDLLPGRGRRGAQGHHRRHPRAHRPPPDPADREDGRAAPRPPRLPARHLLQPRLPERAQGPQAVDPPAVRQPRVRLPGRRRRGDDHRPRGRRRRRAVRGSWRSIGEKTRNLREHGFHEGVSTRLLVYAAQLVVGGIEPRRACDVAIARAISDDVEVQRAVAEIVDVAAAVTRDRRHRRRGRRSTDMQRVLGLFADGDRRARRCTDRGRRGRGGRLAVATIPGATARRCGSRDDRRVRRRGPAIAAPSAPPCCTRPGYASSGRSTGADERDAALRRRPAGRPSLRRSLRGSSRTGAIDAADACAATRAHAATSMPWRTTARPRRVRRGACRVAGGSARRVVAAALARSDERRAGGSRAAGAAGRSWRPILGMLGPLDSADASARARRRDRRAPRRRPRSRGRPDVRRHPGHRRRRARRDRTARRPAQRRRRRAPTAVERHAPGATSDQEQIGRLADIDATDPELPVEEEPAAAVGTPSDPVPAPRDEDHGARIYFYDEWDHVARR